MTVVLVGAGLFFAIAAVGGSHVAPFAALACGWLAGRQSRKEPQE